MSGHCPEVERLGAFVDGELPSTETDAVRTHVSGCAVCRERIAGLASLNDALAFDDSERPATEWEALAARVDRAVEDASVSAAAGMRPIGGARRFAFRPLAFGGAGILAAAALVALFVPLLDSPRELPRPRVVEREERASSVDRAGADDREQLRALGSVAEEGGPDLRAVKQPFDPGPGLAAGANADPGDADRKDADPKDAKQPEADRGEAAQAEPAPATTPPAEGPPPTKEAAKRSAVPDLKKELSPPASALPGTTRTVETAAGTTAPASRDESAPVPDSVAPDSAAPVSESAPAGTRPAIRSASPKQDRPATPDTAFARLEAAPPAAADTVIAEQEIPAPTPERAAEPARSAGPPPAAGPGASLESLREQIEERHRVGRTPTANDGWGRGSNRMYRGDAASRATRERALTAALAQEMLVFAMEWEAEGDIAAARRAYLTLVSQDSEFRSVREQAWKELIELEAREALRSGDEEDLLLAVQTAEAFLREYRASALRSEVLRPRVRLWAALVRMDPDEHCSSALTAAAQWEARDLERPARAAEAAGRIRATCLD